jgi:signal transduction histidine kinase/ligand-binding sensor domain-containing protein
MSQENASGHVILQSYNQKTSWFRPMRRLLGKTECFLAALFVLTIAVPTAWSAAPEPGHFHHTMWTAENGLGAVVDIQQAPDGYLWLTTSTGVFRFDGVSFQSVEEATNGAVRNSEIHAVYLSPSGGLWLKTRAAGLLFWKDGRLTTYTDRRCTPALQMEGIAEGRDGSLWLQGSGGLFRMRGSVCEQIGPEHGYPGGFPAAILVDRKGTVWVRTLTGVLLSMALGQPKFESIEYDPGAASAAFLLASATHNTFFLHEAPDGSIWLSDDHGLRRLTDQKGAPIAQAPPAKGPGGSIRFGDFTFAGDAIWAVSDQGLRRFDHIDQWPVPRVSDTTPGESFTTRQGLSSDAVWKVLIDREGSIWVGTNSGLDRLRRTALTSLSLPPAQEHDFSIVAGDLDSIWTGNLSLPLTRVAADGTITTFPKTLGSICLRRLRDGTIWSAGGGQNLLWHFTGAAFSPMRYPEDEFGPVMALAVDRNNDLWINTAAGGTYHFADGKWTREDDALGRKPGTLGAMTGDDRGNVWFGFSNYLLKWDGSGFQRFSFPNGRRGVSESTMSVRGDRVWLGGTGGVSLFTKGVFYVMQWKDQNLPGRVSGVLETETGDLWMNGFSGITHVTAGELARFLHDPAHAVSAEHLDALDGLPGLSTERIPEPSLAESTDGRLWFATTRGIAWLDPVSLHQNLNQLPPPVIITSILSNGKTYPGSSDLTLPAHTDRLEINYTALSLAIPERVMFRYKLEGVDSDWQNAGTRRQAFYTHLPPGNFRFRVIACNNDGVWNATGANLAVSIQPAFYQTWWFLTLVVFAAAALMWWIIRRRIAGMARQFQDRLAERLAERERIARELHDTLLQSLFGLTLRFNTAAGQLPAGDPAREALDEALQQADKVMQEGRERVLNLRGRHAPRACLADALAQIGQQLRSIHPAHFQVSVQGRPRSLDAIVQEEILLIGREALTNAFTHSGGKHIEAQVSYHATALHVCVTDDGGGIDEAVLEVGYRSGHWGLPGMRERAAKLRGELRVGRSKEGGTQIDLQVPGAIVYRADHPKGPWPWNRFRRKNDFAAD